MTQAAFHFQPIPHPYPSPTPTPTPQSTLEFHLRLQEFVELVRGGKSIAAITFARRHLAPWAADHLEVSGRTRGGPRTLTTPKPFDRWAVHRHTPVRRDRLTRRSVLCDPAGGAEGDGAFGVQTWESGGAVPGGRATALVDCGIRTQLRMRGALLLSVLCPTTTVLSRAEACGAFSIVDHRRCCPRSGGRT